MHTKSPWIQIVATLLVLVAAPAAAQELDTALGDSPLRVQFISGRTVIDQPGAYLVVRNITNNTVEPTIRVLASGVSIDLGGFQLLGAVATPAGVWIDGASNVQVRNGTLRGFGVGVRVTGATNVDLTGLSIDARDTPSPTPEQREIGMMIVDSRGVDVHDNVITGGFLGVFVRGDGSGGNRIAGNVITGGDNGELGICYNPAPGATTGGPHGDLVYDNLVSRWRRGLSFSADSTGNVVRDNTVAYFDLSIEDRTAPGSNLVADNDALQIAR